MRADSELTVAGLAHDLNNVFETLAEAAELLASDGKWTKLAGTIRRSVRRGERIVASISESIVDPGDLGEILDNAVQHAEDVLTFTRGTAIQYTRQVQPGVTLPGSPAAWERVFVNLFLNAAQANPQGVEIAIEAGSRRHHHDRRRQRPRHPRVHPAVHLRTQLHYAEIPQPARPGSAHRAHHRQRTRRHGDRAEPAAARRRLHAHAAADRHSVN